MPAFTFVLKKSGSDWKATRVSSEEPELSAEGASTSELQKTLKSLAIENSSGGNVAVLFSTISSDAAVYQVNVGGAVASGGGGGSGAAATGGAGDAPAAKEEAKKEEEEEESGDEDMGFSLFD